MRSSWWLTSGMQTTLAVSRRLFIIRTTESNCLKRTQIVYLQECVKTNKLSKISSRALMNLIAFLSIQHHRIYEPCNQQFQLQRADFTTAKADGESKLKECIDERVYSKKKSLHNAIKRNSRLTFAKASSNRTSEGSDEGQTSGDGKQSIDICCQSCRC